MVEDDTREEKRGGEEVPAVRIEHLVKDFAVPFRREKLRAVGGISLEMAAGEVYGLIGPNGSGKSTTMKVLLGLIAATSGRTAIFGVSSRRVSSRREVGYLPENPYFYKHVSGAETLRGYGRLCGVRGGALAERIGELLELVDLEDASDRRLGGYSKGMLQRIGLAQALIQDPRLVVLDEPTAGVDPAGSRKMRDLILEMKGRGISVILCSHLLEQVQEVCDRVGIIHRGKLVKEGALEELINIEEQTDIVLENAPAELLEEIRATVEGSAARLVRMGHPRTTLERLFLRETGGEEGEERRGG
ncbi:MAG: ABC transporter ATP-binding protein [Verrucomicrobiota bacterium]